MGEPLEAVLLKQYFEDNSAVVSWPPVIFDYCKHFIRRLYTYTFSSPAQYVILKYHINHQIHTRFESQCSSSWTTKLIQTIHHNVVCLRRHPQPLIKLLLHRGQSRASPSNFQYSLVSLTPFSCSLRLLRCLSITSIIPSIFPCCRRQFLRHM